MLIRKNIKNIVILLIIALLIAIGMCIFLITKLFKKEIYRSEDRVSNIMAEQKKDQSNNYKTVGWLRVQGTNIDTPIIAYNDINKDKAVNKNDYLWNNINDEKFHNKVNILGHNILNLSEHPDSGLEQFSRFDDLMSFVYYDFIKDNKYIEYTIDGHNYVYKIYSVNFDKQYNLNLYRKGNSSKNKLNSFIKKTKKDSIYNFDVSVNDKDNFISLVTCTRLLSSIGSPDMEFVVNARMVRKGEKLINYKVTKNKNYNRIEKILKGSENDETDA